MLFKFKNLGIVESANIEIKGLTIIAGLNDSGKSTVSKGIYTIIKSIRDTRQIEKNYLFEEFDVFFQNIRKILFKYKSYRNIVYHIKDRIAQSLINSESIEDIIDAINESQIYTIREILENRTNIRKGEVDSDNTDDIANLVQIEFEKYKKSIGIPFDVRAQFVIDLNRRLKSNFRFQHLTIGKDESLEFEFMDDENEIISVEVNSRFIIPNIFNNSKSYDATFIDSPTIINFLNFVVNQTLQNQPKESDSLGLPDSYYDLVLKLRPYWEFEDYASISNEISDTIGGRINFDDNSNTYKFERNDGCVIDVLNLANGIKSFSILQLLMNGGNINPWTILLIDEPEVHLHPSWEIKYAEIIISLVKANVPILISSHSPYLINAIVKGIRDNDLQDISRFYFGEKSSENQLVKFKDVTDDLTPIFSALSEPMTRIF